MQPRILVVDDSPAIRGLIVLILENAGYRVRAVADADAATAASHDLSASDLVICDVNLTGQNGIGLCERLRTATPGLNIIYMSGQNMHPPLTPGSAFLLKPFKPEALVAKVREMVGT